MKTTLCIDIGNTTTHIGLVDVSNPEKRCVYQCNRQTEISPDNADFSDKSDLFDILNRISGDNSSTLTGIAYCSVVPQATNRLKSMLNRMVTPLPSFHLTSDNCPGLAINYPRPAGIGQDRLANAIAAQALFGVPVIVIDMGTAVTFDIVSINGYEGGIIAPGLEIMTRYLHQQTALLPELDPNDLVAASGIGKTTRDAMRLGCSVGFSGMIHSLLECVIQELRSKGLDQPRITVIGTGGSTGILPQKWLSDIEFMPDLTLFGLAEAYIRHQKRLKQS